MADILSNVSNVDNEIYKTYYSLMTVYIVACFVVLFLNGGVIIIILRNTNLRRNATLTYCVSLSSADVAQALTYLLNIMIQSQNIQIPSLCIIAKTLALVCGLLSSGSVTLLMIHRYVSIKFPILHRNSHTLTVSVTSCITMWIVCILIQFLPYATAEDKVAYKTCSIRVSYWKELPHIRIQVTVIGCTIFFLIVLLHFLTLIEMRRLCQRIKPESCVMKNGKTSIDGSPSIKRLAVKESSVNKCNKANQSNISSAKASCSTTKMNSESDTAKTKTILKTVRKSARVTVGLSLGLLVCCLPFLIVVAIGSASEEWWVNFTKNTLARRLVLLLFFCNGLINPIIYAGNQEQIRKEISRILSLCNWRST